MSWLGWVTVAATVLAFAALVRCLVLVARTFPQLADHGAWKTPVKPNEHAESWPHTNVRVARISLVADRPQAESSTWLRAVTPLAATGEAVRRERESVDAAPQAIPDQWSPDWLTNACAEIEAEFGLELPPRPAVRERRWARWRRRLSEAKRGAEAR